MAHTYNGRLAKKQVVQMVPPSSSFRWSLCVDDYCNFLLWHITTTRDRPRSVSPCWGWLFPYSGQYICTCPLREIGQVGGTYRENANYIFQMISTCSWLFSYCDIHPQWSIGQEVCMRVMMMISIPWHIRTTGDRPRSLSVCSFNDDACW